MMLLLIIKILQSDALTSILIRFYEAFTLQMLLWLKFNSYHDHFYAKMYNYKYKLPA